MALDRELARLAKLLVESEGITYPEAQDRLRGLTLEILVGADATSPAAHAAVLTAVSVGSRTFIGGVRVGGALDQRLNSTLSLAASTLAEAAVEVGAVQFEGRPSRRIVVGTVVPQQDEIRVGSTWWQGWRAGTTSSFDPVCDAGENPLSGIAAGALAVGVAFEAVRGLDIDVSREVDLWPADNEQEVPAFAEVYLPGALWLIGLGNLGQAFLWALAALPYANPGEVSLVLQDRDRIKEENWATSILVKSEAYGELKTRVAETWAMKKKFGVRRVDRFLLGGERLEDQDPRIALCGVDKIAARKLLAKIGFDCIVDVGLGRRASDFDRYRVTVFDNIRPIDKHFDGHEDEAIQQQIPHDKAYEELEAEIGQCGTAEIAGASVAVPYVSAIAAVVAVARLIAIVSGCACRINETRRLSSAMPKMGPLFKMEVRGARHAGRPI